MRQLDCGFGGIPATIGLNPVYWFFVSYLIRHHKLVSFGIAFLGTAMGAAALQVSGLYCSRIRSATELRRDDRLRNGDLDSVPIESLKEIIPPDLWLDLVSARAEQSPLWRNQPKAQGSEVYVLIYQPRTAEAPWTPGSAFLGSVGLRTAIVRDNPLTARWAWSRFLFLHELAHVSSEGVALQIARWRMVLTMLHAVITVFLLAAPLGQPLLTGALVLAVVLALTTFLRFERLCESYADASAFAALPSESDRVRVLALMEREVAAASEAFGRSHFHTRLWRRRLAALHGPRRRSTFNLSGGTIFDPSAIPFAIASVVAVILAWSSGVASSWQFGIYAGWCLICQLAALLLFLIARNTDATVRITLNQKITDSQTLNEK